MTYQITGDLLSRKGIVVAKGIEDEEACKPLLFDFDRKGWINLKTTKEKKNASTTKRTVPKQGRNTKGKNLDANIKVKPKDDSKATG